jgi:hypothetical protein
MDKWKGSFYFDTLSRQFDHELHYFKVGITHKRHKELQNIITRTMTLRMHNSCGSLVSWLMDKWKGSFYFLYSFKTVWPWITFNWAGPPTKKFHDNEVNINTRTVTLIAHNSCGSSCIMAHGQMEGIDLFFILFQDSLTMNYTTSRLGLPIRGIRNYKISSPRWWYCERTIHVAPIVSWLNGRWKGSIYFYTLSRQFDHELH